ncbi:MAG: response regulator [Burkholderiaceae bacterium]|nr:MAG: response regulator [Burkholderiaceae bacterium]
MKDSGIILCVDDDTTVLMALRTLLEHALGSQYLIEIAESGEEALEILEDLQKDGETIGVVISDFLMPGMRGDELLIEMHRRSPRTVTIMLTGQSDFDGVKKAINQANLYRFLEKPFNHEDIVLTVRSALQAYSHERLLNLQNDQLRHLNADLNVTLKKLQESERFLEERVALRTRELDEKNQALQQALRTLEDVERISRHDLKTPLVSIAAAPTLLRAGRTMSKHEEDILCMIESATNRALSMVNLSLDLFRMESGSYVFRPSSVDMTNIVASVAMGLAAHAHSKSVNIHIPDDEPHVFAEADDSLCYSIIGNLLKNAVEAAPEHSTVMVTLIDGPQILLAIHNQGAVPAEMRANFFDKYATAGKVGGTGLGTYSSHLLAKVQGGSLGMHTSDEDGTTLTLKLHRAKPQSTQKQDKEFGQAHPRPTNTNVARAINVLLVDDDDFNHMVMSDNFRAPEFKLDVAINGRMAIERAQASCPDLIIMDIEMPVMGGVEAMLAIREQQTRAGQKPSFIVAYSGHDDDRSRQRFLELGFDACLGKPCSHSELDSVLEQARQQTAVMQ